MMGNVWHRHPIIIFLYYLLVFTITIVVKHPIILVLSLIGSLLFFLCIVEWRRYIREITYYFFVFILISLAIPRFNHKGETILFFLNDLPITYEALVFGIMMSLKIVALIFWFKTFLLIFSIDKIVYLFGNLSSSLSVGFLVSVQFFATFKQQVKQTSMAHKAIGYYTSDSIFDRLISFFRVCLAAFLFAMSQHIERLDIMKARGYGIKRRTHFSLFKWRTIDTVLITTICGLLILIIVQVIRQQYTFHYYPTLTAVSHSIVGNSHFIGLFILFIIPTLVEIKELIQWNYLKLKI